MQVLVPFYRGAVVFGRKMKIEQTEKIGSRPLLSRSGCIFGFIRTITYQDYVLVPFYRGAVVFYHDN